MARDRDAISAQVQGELARLDRRLARHVQRIHASGRPATAIAAHVIGDDEVATLLRVLAYEHRDREPADDDDDDECLLATLERTRQVYDLTPFDCAVLVLAMASDVDGRYARVFAYLNDHGGQTWPTLGLASALFESLAGGRIDVMLARFGADAPLRRHALVDVTGNGPLPTHRLQLAHGILERLLGLEVDCGVAIDRGAPITDRVLGDGNAARIADAAAWLAACPSAPLLIVRGNPATGRDTIARTLARTLASTVIVDQRDDVPANVVLREARWDGAPVVTRSADHVRLQALARGDRPLFVVAEKSATLPALDRPQLEIMLPDLTAADRMKLWAGVLASDGSQDEQTLGMLATHFRFGPAQVETVARTANARCAATGVAPGARDIFAVAREVAHVELAALAQRLPCPFERADIVLQRTTELELELAIAWACHAAPAVAALPGKAHWSSSGLTCMFVGPPGTGKTMAAQVLAREIGLDLWRVDLSQLFNKYIGETEKNLAKIFDAAEQASAILFFDEADAVFGRRTEVKNANDRFANVETAYLLQRLELHPGVAILASNLRGNIDNAFMRRLHIIADFPLPGVPERTQIWERLLPRQRAADVDLEFLARRFAIAGGDIRNAALAGLVSAARDREPLAMRHLVFGLWRELRKSGRMIAASDFGEWQHLVLDWSKQAARSGTRELSS